jgi:hypothetical protein
MKISPGSRQDYSIAAILRDYKTFKYNIYHLSPHALLNIQVIYKWHTCLVFSKVIM